ncbi:GNAT family N-acetyltransferase [Candidatus Woesearchaeota archaeon]|nr:GNAT family N-acetyltransferase [Candidatus Woesearchaeota archaeon]
MRFRKATPHDAPALVALIQAADKRSHAVASKKVRKFITSEQGFFLVAEHEGKFIGYLLFMITEEDIHAAAFLPIANYACVSWVAVHPEFRGAGIGSGLLREAGKYAKEHTKHGVWLDCRASVIDFYKKNGFENVGVYQKATASGTIKPSYVMVKSV